MRKKSKEQKNTEERVNFKWNVYWKKYLLKCSKNWQILQRISHREWAVLREYDVELLLIFQSVQRRVRRCPVLLFFICTFRNWTRNPFSLQHCLTFSHLKTYPLSLCALLCNNNFFGIFSGSFNFPRINCDNRIL